MKGRRGRWSDDEQTPTLASISDNEASMDEDEEEDDDDDDDDEAKSLSRQRAYEKYLPEVKRLVRELHGDQKPNLLTEKDEKSCAVCPTIQWFKGWKALVAHAATFKKKRIQQHRGYHQALTEALRIGERPEDDENSLQQARTVSISSTNVVIVWPPVLLVSTLEKDRHLSTRARAFLMREFPDLHETECRSASETSVLMVFIAEAIGYMEAQMVGKWFAQRQFGRDDITRCRRRHIRQCDEDGQPSMFAFLATPEDMEHIDGDRKLLKWTKESQMEKVKQAQKKSKQEHDNDQATLRATALKVETLARDEAKFKENKHHIEQLIGAKHVEVKWLEKRAEERDMKYKHDMKKLDEAFQKELTVFEAHIIAREKRLRQELEQNEKRLEEEQNIRKKEIESLKQRLQTLTQDLKQIETQKALDRELEAMQKKKSFMADMAKAEATFNQQAREQESSLQEKQHREKMQLMEEVKLEREKILKEWLDKQEALKKDKQAGEQLEKEAMQTPECAICLDQLNHENRAYFIPCGHAKTCLSCAKEIYQRGAKLRICPICREKITKKPKLLPSKLYL